MARRFKTAVVRAAIAELDKVRDEWLRRPGVTGVDVGYRMVAGERSDELAIRVHMEQKPAALSFSTRGERLGEFKIDYIEANYGLANGSAPRTASAASVNRKRRVDPLVGGVSVGNPRVSAGTLGALVWDRNDGAPCLLSNWHVLCGHPDAQVGESIYQPGKLDRGTEADTVATLLRWVLNSNADAALARLNGEREFVRDILGIQPITGVEERPRLGQLVVKSGRTTGVTEGMIDGMGMSLVLNYKGDQRIIFHDQLRIVPRPPWPDVAYEVSKGGDSGSIWMAESSGKAVGLHFAGETDTSPSAEYAVANRMSNVAELLNISLTPLFACGPGNGGGDGEDDEAPVTVDLGDVTPPQDKKLTPRKRAGLRAAIRIVLCRALPALCAPGGFAFSPGAAPPEVDVDALIEQILTEVEGQE